VASGTSLQFTVRVAKDQAEQALKAMTTAFNQAGVAAQTSFRGMGAAAQGAGTQIASTERRVSSFKESLSRSREAAMFFTSSLGAFGAEGRTAQIAISGVAGALLGGGGVLLALQAVNVAARLFAETSREEAEASRKAAEAARERAAAYAKTRVELERLRYTQAGGAGEVFDADRANREANKQVAEAQRVFNEARAAYDRAKAAIPAARDLSDEDANRYYGNLRKLYAGVSSAAGELAAAEANRASVSEIGSRRASAAIDSETAALGRRNDALQDGLDLQASTVGPDTPYRYSMQDDPNQKVSTSFLPIDDGLKVSQKEIERGQEKYNDQLRASIALNQQWGDAIGSVVGAVMTGQATVGQAMAQVGQMIVKSVVQSAIAQITANASTAASGAAASQAGIPVVGPVLAISAMGAMLSAVMGLMSNLPSARNGWWDTGSYEGLMWIHANERVLNAKEAQDSRSGGGVGGPTLNVYAYDAKGFDRVLGNHNSALAREMRQIRRRRLTT
jgi:hypothetical protein